MDSELNLIELVKRQEQRGTFEWAEQQIRFGGKRLTGGRRSRLERVNALLRRNGFAEVE